MNFKKLSLTCTALFLLSAVTLTAFGQAADPAAAPAGRQGRGQGGGRQQGGRGGALVMLPLGFMDTVLKLDADQKTKITDIQAKYKEDAKAFTPAAPVAGAPPADPAARQEMMQKRGAAVAQADKDIQAVLTDDQKKLIPDLNKATQTLRTVGIPVEVVGDLKLTDPQAAKMTTIADDSQKEMMAKMTEARQGGNVDRAAMMQMMQDATKATHEKARLVLTSSQRTKLDAYLKDHPQPVGGRGFGGFGGGRPGGAPATPPPAP